jgi:hypothetical protein
MIVFFIVWSVFFVFLLYWIYSETPSDLKVRDLKIPKKKFVLLVLQWCSENLGNGKQHYQLQIYYYPHKKYSGQYFSGNRQIVIWVYDDLNLVELTDTIIHEYIHYQQYTKSSTQIEYDKKLVAVGYKKNPFEKQARKIGRLHRKECFYQVFKQISGD